MVTRSVITLVAGMVAALGVASAATRVEPLMVRVLEGDGAGSQYRGSLSFDDSGLPSDLSMGFSVDAANDALQISFPLPLGVVADETQDFEYPVFPRATFDGNGRLVDLEFLVLEPELLVEVLGDLTFFFEIGLVNAPLAAGSGRVFGGTAVPVPGAALLFAPLAGAFAGRRLLGRR